MAKPEGQLLLEAALESPDLLLQAINPGLQIDQLGAERHLVHPLLEPVHPLFEALQPCHDHLILGSEPVETLLDGVEVRKDLVEPGGHLAPEPLLRGRHDPLDVRNRYRFRFISFLPTP